MSYNPIHEKYIRDKYLTVKNKYPNRKIQRSRILMLDQLSNQSTLEFSTKQEVNGVHPLENRINNEDTFHATHMRFGILPVNTDTAAKSFSEKNFMGTHDIQTFPNPLIFKEHWETFAAIWSGRMEIKIGDDVIYKALPLSLFKFTPEFQDFATKNVAGEEDVKISMPIWNPMAGFFQLEPMQGFKGAISNTFVVNFTKVRGTLDNLIRLSDSSQTTFYGAIELLGYQVINGNLNK